MKRMRSDSAKTRLRLLEAACMVFGEKGFKNARISDICKLAGVNGALVNYHFGNKENLYQEAWRFSHRKSICMYPLDQKSDTADSPEERLYSHINSLLRRIGERGYNFAIMRHELSNPTGLLAEIMKKELAPLHLNADAIFRELLGPTATERQVQFCHSSVMAQCFHLIRPKHSGENDTLHIDDIEAYIDHVYTFSLAGIEKLRDVKAGSGLHSDNESDLED